MMKAIQLSEFGAPDVLRFTEVPRPSPGPDQVLIRISAISVNNSETVVRRGQFPGTSPLPLIIGDEYCGVVEEVGSNVKTFEPGQTVTVFGKINAGAYAQYAAAPVSTVYPLPDQMDHELGAAFPVAFLIAYNMLHLMGAVRTGSKVLVYGAAGGVGSAVVQLANRAGCEVIALVSSPERATHARAQGAAHAINYKQEDVAEKVMAYTDGTGVDLILNSAAGDTFKRDFDVLARFGLIVWYGLAAGMPSVNVSDLLMANFMKSKGIRTFTITNLIEQRPDLLKKTLDELVPQIVAGDVVPHIGIRLPLKEAVKAHSLMESSSVCGRIILNPW